MGSSGNFTLFTNDSGSAAGPINFVSDVFQDVSLSASNNTGFSTSIAKNPLGLNLANTDSPNFGAKSLFIKDLVLVQDRSLWINGRPTYSIIWNENYPSIQGYVFGDVQVVKIPYTTVANASVQYNRYYVQFNTSGDGIAINSFARQVQFYLNGTTGTGTAQVVVDGVNGNTINFGSETGDGEKSAGNKLVPYIHATTKETYDIHDIRLTANQASTLKVTGIVAYFENTSQNIDLSPGTTYVQKNKAITSVGSTLGLPAVGSSLGGRSVIYKTVGSAYAISTLGATQLTTAATGNSGTNSLQVTTGTGGSFPVGTGFMAFSGSTAFIGKVTIQSTDTLTITPTLMFGVSGPFYKTWSCGPSLAISSSLMILDSTIGYTQMQFSPMLGLAGGLSYLEPTGKYAMFGYNMGVTYSAGSTVIPALYQSLAWLGASGFLQVDGYFSAADIELSVGGQLNLSVGVNGTPGFTMATSATGPVKFTVMNDAGPGLNSFILNPGTTFNILSINKINLYTRQRDLTVSGQLAEFDTLQQYSPRNHSTLMTANATMIPTGTFRRHYSDQMAFSGAWTRTLGASFAGNVAYLAQSGSTSCTFRFEYFGDHFSILGSGGTMTLTLDGASYGAFFNRTQLVSGGASMHILVGTAAGATIGIEAIDFHRSVGSLKNLQNYNPISSLDGSIVNDLSIDGNKKIKDETVTLSKSPNRIVTLDGTDPGVGGMAIGNSSNAITTTGYSDMSISMTITTSGRHVEIRLVPQVGDNNSTISFNSAGARNCTIAILRDGSVIASTQISNPAAGINGFPASAIVFIDYLVPAGTHVYKCQAKVSNSDSTINIGGCNLLIREIT